MNKKYLKLLFILPFVLQASVEHKDEFIDTYLSNISNSMDEKTQILEHILKNPEGRFIDIGTGGDSVVIIAKQLPKNCRPTLIGADIDPLVIESIQTRRPEIKDFLNNSRGPKIELLAMSATDMDRVGDSSLAGISASALAHEIYSYVPHKSALDQFVSETCRVLEKNGIFVYRDPKWVDDPETRCIMTIRSEIGKYYASLFLTKFLDRKHSLIKDYRGECCKPSIYKPDEIKITAFLKPAHKNIQMTFSEFLKVLCSDIDYTKSFSIEAPKGLLSEIQRHYLMYLRDYFPAALLEDTHFMQSLNCNTLTHEQISAMKSYAQRKKIPIVDEVIDQATFPLFFQELEILRNIFSKGYAEIVGNRTGLRTVTDVLLSLGLDRNLFYFKNDQTLTLDPKMLTLLFHGKRNGIFQHLAIDNLPIDLLEHLKLEGEEHYFYKTTDELITYIGQYSRFILKNSSKRGYCLAPIDPSYIREANRCLYRSILTRDTSVMDLHGNIQEPVTGKNIIHFQLQPERKAFTTYKKLIQADPHTYRTLKQWVNQGDHEMLDLVSNDDVVIGVMPRVDIYGKNLSNFRVVNAFLINSEGDLWIPTRHASKPLFPLALDCSVGGHVLSNESYFDAFCRESKEEINIDPRDHKYQFLSKLTPETHKTSAFMEVYTIEYEGPVQFNPDDFSAGEWISPKRLKRMLKEGSFAKNDLKIILEACFPDA